MIRRRPSRQIGAALAIGLALAGCGDQATVPLAEPTIPAELLFTCAEATFPAAALDRALGAEAAEEPAAASLRRFLRSSDLRAEDLPLNGYRVLSASADRVVFATTRLGGGPMVAIDVRLTADRWAVVDLGPCAPALTLPGLHVGSWRLKAGAPPPDPATTSFEAFVSETECVSGRTADGRVLPPRIIREPRRVLVVFGIRPPPTSGIETCPAPPPTRVVVDLGEPLGARELLDGGQFPPADPWSPDCCG